MSRANKIIILVFTLLIATGFYFWFYVFNQGTLVINSFVDNYQVVVDTDTYSCSKNPCSIDVDAGSYVVTFQKDGYFPVNDQIQINRQQLLSIEPDWQKVPQLIVSPIVPPDLIDSELSGLPDDLEEGLISSAKWNDTGDKLAFIDLSEGLLKIWQKNQPFKIITPLSEEFIRFYWSLDDRYLFGLDGQEIYVINILLSSRKKQLLDYFPTTVRWSPDSQFLMLNDEQGRLHRFSLSDGASDTSGISLNLEFARFISASEIIYFINNIDTKGTTVQHYNPISDQLFDILEAPFLADQIRYYKKNVYFRDQDTKTWYLLERD